MATADARRWARNSPREATIALSVAGYALVIGTFLLDLPIYPDLSEPTVDLLTHVIAGINVAATVLLALGWYWIRRNAVEKHRYAMVGAFVLISLFLVVYLLKVGGGGVKYIEGAPDPVYYAYLAMLAIHVVLSVVAVPVVLYALILGLTHTPLELRGTNHARFGRIAAAAWILSLVLGVVTYVMLNWIYDSTFQGMVVPVS